MTSGRKSKAARKRSVVVARKPKPWGTILAVTAVVALAAGVFGYAYAQISKKNNQEQAEAAWTPSEDNQDPSKKITGVVKKDYKGRDHVKPTQRVAYDQTPPIGGAHDGNWADCTGTIYTKPVRVENMVHSLEHGAVWLAYNPERISGTALETLNRAISNRPYAALSPYPGLDRPIALQAWGRQLKLDKPDDERIGQFLAALSQNPYTTPEQGATCDANPGQFDIQNPPPFDPTPPGPDAVPVNGTDAPPGAGGGN